MKHSLFSLVLFPIALLSCTENTTATGDDTKITKAPAENVKKEVSEDPARSRHYRGALQGGMKGDSIFFDVSADGKRLENLTFKGYWYCDGSLEQQNPAGPEGHFTIVDGKVDGHISEPPNGGATAWRFDLSATISGNKASGTFRMNINALRCNTGTLKWEAVAD